MYKIIASDLDGTLLTPEHKIAPFSRSVLQKLHQRGEHFVFATGRHHEDVAAFRAQVGIPAYMITSNGACVHDSEDNLIFQKTLDPALVRQVVALTAHDDNLIVHIYQADQWLLSHESEEMKAYHKESGHSYVVFDCNNPPTDNVLKVFITHKEHEYLLPYEEKLIAALGTNAAIAFSSLTCLEVMAEGVSKGAALQVVAERLGYQLADCVAFGDGMNDYEMLSMAGKGLIMGTAHDRLKAALPNNEVIGNCVDEAVAHYLAEHIVEIAD
uniref:Cof-type HAD-IIB family hydrolase n=1 Tax=Thaumasiovibrio occultus TaxID=1891184 RepID=UPI000B34CDC9|nr:Cof-type HAD-IIB family hydrolase [Thaumasiovibrio occultus]